MRNITATFLGGISLLFGGCATVDLTEIMGQKADGQNSIMKDPASQSTEEKKPEESNADIQRSALQRRYVGCFLMNGINDERCVAIKDELDGFPSISERPPEPILASPLKRPDSDFSGFQPAS